MGDVGGDKAAEGPFGRILRWLSLAAGGILVILLLYTVLDVVLRYVFNMPFRGSREFTQFMMAAIVFLGLAYCGWTGGHVAVDILEQPLDKPGWRWVPAVLALVSAILFAAIAWYTLHDGIAQMRRVSNMLRWPIYPFVFIAALGSAAYSAVLFVQAARAMRQGKRESQ